MRKIDKDLNLATEYKNWLDAINAKGQDHPAYNSSRGDHYNAIVANLLWVQLRRSISSQTELKTSLPNG